MSGVRRDLRYAIPTLTVRLPTMRTCDPRVVVFGVGVGTSCVEALLATRVLRTPPFDAALLACAVPALRAAPVPVDALRSE
ncbi:MAG: hypothetical protein ABI682_02615 [Acidobacteriota bacterium]